MDSYGRTLKRAGYMIAGLAIMFSATLTVGAVTADPHLQFSMWSMAVPAWIVAAWVCYEVREGFKDLK